MPANANVFVHYGPYNAYCTVEHTTDRLDGLKILIDFDFKDFYTYVLQNDGHKVEYTKMQDWNAVELWVNGIQVFKTDIRELDFGGDGELDQLCAEALKKVREAF